jgi:hypothetical protein
MKQRILSLTKPIVTATVLIILEIAFSHLLARARLLEHLLAPGPGSTLALAATVVFLLLRIVVILVLPGWSIAQLWLWLIERHSPRPSTKHSNPK